MRPFRPLLLSIPVLALALSHEGDASACGGCFIPPIQQSETTQVTGHKMILAVSQVQTTLWDQIEYTGAPASFAWVLPIKGVVTVGLSSDLLFGNLDATTTVTVASPVINCPQPPSCGGGTGAGGGASLGSGGPPPVTVTAQSVVGPYETVQLHSSDPAALTAWLTDHSFVIPADVKPIIDAYVGEGFDFLALKLVPGKDVKAMRPVRVTMPGASPVLPLRMVAAGTGATTPLNLWVVGEGRYEPTNMPDFGIEGSELTWDWDTMSSDYTLIAKAKFAANQGKGWLLEASEPFDFSSLDYSLTYLAANDPIASGYADEMGNGAPASAQDDLSTLSLSAGTGSIWITRLHAELSRQALSTDLTLGASLVQSPVNRYLQVTKTRGTAPLCRSYPPCSSSSGGCAVTHEEGFSSTFGALSVLAALALARRRRGRGR